MPPADEKVRYIRRVRERFVDPTTESILYKQFVEFASPRIDDDHYLRNMQTFAGLVSRTDVLERSGSNILETGGYSLISRFLIAKGFAVACTSSDLREEINFPADTFDLVLSLEVLEHLKDRQERQFSDVVLFRGTGARQYANEIKRVLRPGGIFLLTTPNPCSLKCLINLLDYKSPMIFRPHVREYTIDEIKYLFEGLDIMHYHANYSFGLLGDSANVHLPMFEMLGKSTADRGDDHFLLAQKPSASAL
jgi:SAM-dependent methyltransferase